MSNDRDRHLHRQPRHSAGPTPLSQSDCLTEVLPVVAPVPTRRSILRAAPSPSPFAGWRDQTQTEELPAVSSDPVRHRVSPPSNPTGSRVTLRRHLRAALAGILIAAALLTGLQLYAAAGISQARQAALAARSGQAYVSAPTASPAPASLSGQSPAPSDWVTEDAGSAYDRTDPAASPLELPRCTTSPDTPLPCLATISPDSRRAVVLEEDASLTALTRR